MPQHSGGAEWDEKEGRKIFHVNFKVLCLLTVLSLFVFQPLTSRLYYYYILELAFYWSLMFSQFTDIKRKVRLTRIALTTLLNR